MAPNPKKLLTEWYGHDKVIPRVTTKYPAYRIGFQEEQRRGYTFSSRDREYTLSEEALNLIKKLDSEQTKKLATKLYFPPCDGFTEQDFVDWVVENKDSINYDSSYVSWRTIKSMENTGYLASDYHSRNIWFDFLNTNRPNRKDSLLRQIELNEFAHNGKEDQTFEDFLLTNTEYEDRCKKLFFKKYSKMSDLIVNYSAPDFMQFGPKVNMKTRKLLLTLTKQEMLKVLDYEKNPYSKTQTSDTYTYAYLELFIKHALGEEKKIEIRERKTGEIKNELIVGFISTGRTHFENLGKKHGLTYVLQTFLDELGRASLNTENFTRNFAQLADTGALDELSPIEYAAIFLGYDKSHRWAEKNKGKPTLEIVTELIADKKLSPKTIAQIIAYIIINHSEPIIISADFDWTDLDDVPAEWAYSLIPKTGKPNPLKQPELIKNML